MIDAIIDLKNKELSNKEYSEWENRIISSNDSRLIFLFSYYVKNVSVDKMSEAIIKTDNIRYIRFFMRSIEGIDVNLFVNKVLEIGSVGDLYYTFYDNPYISDDNIIKIIKRIKELDSNSYYIYYLYYYYFIVLNRFNDTIFNLLKKEALYLIKKELTKDNYKDILNNIRDFFNNEYKSEYKGDLSNNCYKNHGGYIPDMIVFHISQRYGKTIKNFFDESTDVSAHYVINYDGEVKQIVALEQSAWANGTSLNDTSDVYYRFSTNDIIRKRNYNANYYTFSIEHISFDGSLTESQYQSSLDTVKKIIVFMKEKYDYDFSIDRLHLVGHNEVNPIVRTSCPGKNFPFARLINDLKQWKENSI